MYATQLLSALFIATSLLVVPGAHASGDFSATCSGFFVRDNHFLQANCGDGVGGFKDTTLDLNRCIAKSGNSLRRVCELVLGVWDPHGRVYDMRVSIAIRLGLGMQTF
ncbi:hypothetical protein PTI98_004289 [Pleurotus ostreatus]|nr:hypothetical protein PTI98_004289 [Pleurotus ostreatus]